MPQRHGDTLDATARSAALPTSGVVCPTVTLAMTMAAGQADALVKRLRAGGVGAAVRVGYATAAQDVSVRLS